MLRAPSRVPADLIAPAPAGGRIQHQHFIGTLWLPDGSNYCTWEPAHPGAFRRACWQHEICPETQRHHIQFYGETAQRASYAQLTQFVGLEPNQVHWECARQPASAWDYCSEDKEDDSSRHGCPSKSIGERPVGKRQRRGGGRDLQPLVESIKHGASWGQLARQHAELIVRHPAGIKLLKKIVQAPKNTPDEFLKPEVIIIYGPGGVGKDRWVREECVRRGLRLWTQPINSRGIWYDGFDAHDAALFSDFDGDMSFRDMFRILEGNGMQVPVKGDFEAWRPSVVFFTSDCHPNSWLWQGQRVQGERALLSPYQLQQFTRRITRILHFPAQRAWNLPADEVVWPETEVVEPLFGEQAESLSPLSPHL